jgi:flagellar hook-associated protein 2
MAGIQAAGLVSGINWNQIISELILADSAGETQLQKQQTFINSQVSALGSIGTDLNNLNGAILNLQDPNLFSNVTASSATTGSTWTVNAETGTPPGSYQINVSKLATAASLAGATGIAAALNNSTDVSGLTLANMRTALPVTAGTITVDGQQINVSLSESLGTVLSAIATATGGTASYDPTGDEVDITGSGPITLGSSGDTSNLLQALQLYQGNPPGASVSSAGRLGSVETSSPIASAGLGTAVTAVDGSGNGSFTINGVTVDYNVNTDSIATVLGRINNSGAGVTASYSASDNQVTLVNNTTGDVGISVSEASGGLLGALGLTGSGTTFTTGVNAQYSVNGGATQTSETNAFDSQALGITGLNVTANTTGTQTINVATDTTAVSNTIQAFITAFNQMQTDIGSDTQIGGAATGSTTVTTSILSGILEVSDWGSSLQNTAFSAGNALTGSINSLNSLGIDFNGTSGQLVVTDSAKLQQALSSNPSGVASFFQTATTGFASIMGSAVIDTVNQESSEVASLQSESTDIGEQITTMQNQLAQQQAQLESEFEAMETALSSIQSEDSLLGDVASSGSSSSGSSSSTSTSPNFSSLNSSSSSSTSGTSAA